MERIETAIIGGGIVGLATARALLDRGGGVTVLEGEARLAAHQSGRNSGVIHAGLYYAPDSLKARLCAAGRARLEAFCADRDIPFRRCGKIVVAAHARQLPALETLEQRARANGIAGVRRIGPDEIAGVEPHAAGVAALHVPETGVVDFAEVVRALAEDIASAGGTVRRGARVSAIAAGPDGLRLRTDDGDTVIAERVINCAGLHADRVARLAGIDPGVSIVPFRGEYHELRPPADALVRALVYPVPDPRYPFLGVHFTRRIDDRVEVGPNALLALARHGYERGSFDWGDVRALLGDRGARRLVRRHAWTGLGELHRAWSHRAFHRAARMLVPDVPAAALVRVRAGIRAQAVDRDGRLVDDFRIVRSERMVHVLNAPSPAATACLAIGERIAEEALGEARGEARRHRSTKARREGVGPAA